MTPLRRLLLLGCLTHCSGPDDASLPSIRIVEASPRGSVEETGPIRVRFSSQVVAEDRVGVPTSTKLFVISPSLEGVFRYVGPATLEFQPSERFTDATRYRVRVRPEAVGDFGVLVGDPDFRFQTSLFGLESLDVRLKRGRVEAWLTFSHAVDPDAVDDAVLFETASGAYLRVRRVEQEFERQVAYRLPFGPSTWPDELVRLRIDGALRSARGTDPLGKTVIRAVEPPPDQRPLELRQVRGRNLGARTAVEWIFSETVDPAAVEAVARIRPAPTDALWVQTRRGVAVLGQFAGSEVEVGLGPLRGREGGVTAGIEPRTVKLPETTAGLELVDIAEQLRLGALGQLQVRVRKVQRLGIAIDVVSRPYVTPALRGSEDVSRRFMETEVSVPDAQTLMTLPLSSQLPSDTGLVRVAIWDAQRPWLQVRRDVLALGIDFMVKRFGRRIRALVYAADHQLVTGARVEVRDETNEVLARGVTGRNGEVDLVVPFGAAPRMVMAHDGARFATLNLADEPHVKPSRPFHEAWAVAGTATVAAGGMLDVAAGLFDPEPGVRLEVGFERETGAARARVDVLGQASLKVPLHAVGRFDQLVVFADGVPVPTRSPTLMVRPPEGLSRELELTAERIDARIRFTATPGGVALPVRVSGRCLYERDGPGAVSWSGPWVDRQLQEAGTNFDCRVAENLSEPVWVELTVRGIDAVGRRILTSRRHRYAPHGHLLSVDVRQDGDATPKIKIHAQDEQGVPKADLPIDVTLLREEPTVCEWTDGGPVERRRVQLVPLAQRQGRVEVDGYDFPEPPTRPGRYRLLVRSRVGSSQVSFEVGRRDGLGLDATAHNERIRVEVERRPSEPMWVSIEGTRLYNSRWLVPTSEPIETVEMEAPDGRGRVDVVVISRTRAAATSVATTSRDSMRIRSLGIDGYRTKLFLKTAPDERFWLASPDGVPSGGLGSSGSAVTSHVGGSLVQLKLEQRAKSEKSETSVPAGISYRPSLLMASRADRNGNAVVWVPARSPTRLRAWRLDDAEGTSLPPLERPPSLWSVPSLDAYLGDDWMVPIQIVGAQEWSFSGADRTDSGRVWVRWTSASTGPVENRLTMRSGQTVNAIDLEGRFASPVTRRLASLRLQVSYGSVTTSTIPASLPSFLLLSPNPEHQDIPDILRLHQMGPSAAVGRVLAGAGEDPVVRRAATDMGISWKDETMPLERAMAALPDTSTVRRLRRQPWTTMEPEEAWRELSALSTGTLHPSTRGLLIRTRREIAGRLPGRAYWGRVDQIQNATHSTLLRFNSKRVVWMALGQEPSLLEISTTGVGSVYGAWLGLVGVVERENARIRTDFLDEWGRAQVAMRFGDVGWFRAQAEAGDLGYEIRLPVPRCLRVIQTGVPEEAVRARSWIEGSLFSVDVEEVLWSRMDSEKGAVMAMVTPKVRGTCVVPQASLWSVPEARPITTSPVGRLRID
ncbi:MAG: hypothetical protein ACFB9M_17130 [Myxococcota bacterium]